MVSGGESRDTSLTRADKYLGILTKLEKEPTVESVFISYWSLPMSGSNSYSNLAAQDTIGLNVRMIKTTGGYTRVFRMQEDAARPFTGTPADKYHGMLTEKAFNYFKKKVPGFSLDTPLNWYGDSTHIVTQSGVIGNIRSYRYGSDVAWFFQRLDENLIKRDYADDWAQIVFRVKDAADSPDYRFQFISNIASRLDTDNMFIADVSPYTDQQLQFEVLKGDTDKVNTQTIVVIFLLVNVFLGVMGTFWFRTRRRRSEIALRLAMGSTKKQVFSLLTGEGLLLLALITIPAMIICYNVGMAELKIGRSELISTWPIEWSFIRFLLGSLGAWILISLMIIIGIWFPARKAIKIHPAEALHED